MGLISQILTLPVMPVRGVSWVLGQVLTAAEEEFYDPGPVHGQLAELERELVAGRITAEEFDLREDELLDRLEWIHAERRRLGLDTRH
ncbi:gas vesicle protein GvpG [Streptomyces sp. TS71-3]|uniref:gas vesicle protein GvpG n=1 Tax=Streptomyces sp. TS71-3 TaxID=2733862 RepID=UPI001B235562|nr:gas vesicle protein GvpG [Streptomyces sp. TS71-3]GHJ37861.1 gas vesicle protein [Streptomyces sp. TS71-3]